MIKRVLTLVSGVQKSVLVDFISQNFASSQKCFHQKFPYKNEKTYISFNIF